MVETLKNILLGAGAYTETYADNTVMYIFGESDCNIFLFLPKEGEWKLRIVYGRSERMKIFDNRSDTDEVFRALDEAITQISLERL